MTRASERPEARERNGVDERQRDRTGRVGQPSEGSPIPYSEAAERDLIGLALLTADGAREVARRTEPADWWTPRHREAHGALCALVGRDEPVTPATAAAVLCPAGGPGEEKARRWLLACQAAAPPAPTLPQQLTHLRGLARRRRDLAVAAQLAHAARDADDAEAAAVRAEVVRLLSAETVDGSGGRRCVPGGAFTLDVPPGVPAVWGAGEEVLWSAGEPCLLVGPQGVGKTTVAGQLALARAGLLPKVLGYPVEPGRGKVLYVAADRPEQVRRSLHRLVRAEDRADLDARLSFWPGPLPHDLARRPTVLAEMARDEGADTIIVDSLKDVAVRLTDDEVGALVNRAFQELVAADVEMLGLHHQRKEQRGSGKPKGLADVYGSGWVTAGCGSVLLLWGEPGDAVVELAHLKQPSDTVGPLQVIHDAHAGTSSVPDRVDAYAFLRSAPAGLTAVALAAELHGTSAPTRNQVEKARRQLDGLVRSGRATKEAGTRGGGPERDLTRYFLIIPAEAP